MVEKRKKKTRNTNTKERAELDRLSALPDGVLHIILFFLGAKETVQTSVLSKRWKNLWTCAPDLDFDSRSFRLVGDFKKFVYAFLDTPRFLNDHVDARQYYNVRTFRLYRDRKKAGKEFTKKVIDFAISHNVEHLDISIKQPGLFPASLLQSQTLKTLQLRGFDLPGSLTFTTVTTLHLNGCYFKNSGIISDGCADPFASCINLKQLCVSKCYVKFLKILKISGGTQLVSLTIDSLWFPAVVCKVEISAPKLVSFSFKGTRTKLFSLINLPSLEQANIDVSFENRNHDEPTEERLNYLFKFMEKLRNVPEIVLFPSTIKALATLPTLLAINASPFHGLKTLKLKFHNASDKPPMVPASLMIYLLSSSPYANIMLLCE